MQIDFLNINPQLPEGSDAISFVDLERCRGEWNDTDYFLRLNPVNMPLNAPGSLTIAPNS